MNYQRDKELWAKAVSLTRQNNPTKYCQVCQADHRYLGMLEGSDEIVECEVCGSEWEKSTGTVTLNALKL